MKLLQISVRTETGAVERTIPLWWHNLLQWMMTWSGVNRKSFTVVADWRNSQVGDGVAEGNVM